MAKIDVKSNANITLKMEILGVVLRVPKDQVVHQEEEEMKIIKEHQKQNLK
jgi:hypothetical protein